MLLELLSLNHSPGETRSSPGRRIKTVALEAWPKVSARLYFIDSRLVDDGADSIPETRNLADITNATAADYDVVSSPVINPRVSMP